MDSRWWANEWPTTISWVSWEKFKIYTIHRACEAEGAGFPRIGPALSSDLRGRIPGNPTPLGFTLHIGFLGKCVGLFWHVNEKRGDQRTVCLFSGCKSLQTRNLKGHILSKIICFTKKKKIHIIVLFTRLLGNVLPHFNTLFYFGGWGSRFATSFFYISDNILKTLCQFALNPVWDDH